MDFEGDNPARMVNNYEWTKDLSAIELLRDIGKYYRLGTMLAKDTVARRLNSDEGISYTEFSYQLLQGMDFLELYRRYGCTLQTGGSDQWGNLTSGTELTRKAEGVTVHALATPLITKADGTKFGKTESGTVWLDPDLTSPYAFYQFWLNQADADVVGYLKVFTFLSREEIGRLERSVAAGAVQAGGAAHARVGGDAPRARGGGRARSVDASRGALWPEASLRASTRPPSTGCAKELGGGAVPPGTSVVDALVEAGVVDSKSAARRAVQEGGAYVNNVKVTDADAALDSADALAGGWFVLRRGKKTIGIVRALCRRRLRG